MAEHRIPQHTGGEERPNITAVTVSSFTRPGIEYRVYPEQGYCSCPHHVHQGARCKHMVLRPALETIRSLPRPEATRDMIEERVLRLARRIYTRPRKDETARESYGLYYEVLCERYATEALRERARARHRLVMERHFEQMSGAA